MAGKQLKCPKCDKTFLKQDHVDRHLRSHTKERPFMCPQCHKCYGRNDTLLRHLRGHKKMYSMSSGTTTNSLLTPDSVSSEHRVSPSRTPHAAPDETIFLTPIEISLDKGILFANDDLDMVSASSDAAPATCIRDGDVDCQAVSGQYPAFEVQHPPWLLQNDFAFSPDDLDFSISKADGTYDGHCSSQTTWVPSESTPRVNDYSSFWFTKLHTTNERNSTSGRQTLAIAQPAADEENRQDLEQRPTHQSQNQQSPSATFLNHCVHLYFLRFHPIFPIVHVPTFQPSQSNLRLYLSICSIGCLYTGSPNAIKLGTQLFESLRGLFMSRWEMLFMEDLEEAVEMVQSALLGQTFGLLSGEGRHLAQVDAFHGTVISWARRCKLFSTCHKPIDVAHISEDLLTIAWREWVRTETHIRICTALYIHDSEICDTLRHEPSLRHNKRQLARPSDDALFMAADAKAWRLQMLRWSRDDNLDQSSPYFEDDSSFLASPGRLFATYQVLEGMAASISEQRLSGRLDTLSQDRFTSRLVSSHQQFFALPVSRNNSFDLHILWHLAFLTLYADLDLLERAVGRDGYPDQKIVAQAQQWAASQDATRCAIHGAVMIKLLEDLPLKHEPALHTPRAIFLAGIVWYCYGVYAPDISSTTNQESEISKFPEFTQLGVDEQSLLSEAQGFRRGRPASPDVNGVLCAAADILQRIGHYGISKRFSSLLSEMIHSGVP